MGRSGRCSKPQQRPDDLGKVLSVVAYNGTNGRRKQSQWAVPSRAASGDRPYHGVRLCFVPCENPWNLTPCNSISDSAFLTYAPSQRVRSRLAPE